jgi:hypothetical protein
MSTRADNRPLRDADIRANRDFFVVDKPNFLTNPAVVADFKVPGEMNSNPASY